jgi:hypothetical protein
MIESLKELKKNKRHRLPASLLNLMPIRFAAKLPKGNHKDPLVEK